MISAASNRPAAMRRQSGESAEEGSGGRLQASGRVRRRRRQWREACSTCALSAGSGSGTGPLFSPPNRRTPRTWPCFSSSSATIDQSITFLPLFPGRIPAKHKKKTKTKLQSCKVKGQRGEIGVCGSEDFPEEGHGTGEEQREGTCLWKQRRWWVNVNRNTARNTRWTWWRYIVILILTISYYSK